MSQAYCLKVGLSRRGEGRTRGHLGDYARGGRDAAAATATAAVTSSLFQTARIEVNAELLVQVCGNRRSQDVYVISPFFACISVDQAPLLPLPLPPLSARFLPPSHRRHRCTDARDERFLSGVVNGCRGDIDSPSLLVFFCFSLGLFG